MDFLWTPAWFKAFSGLCLNMSASWFAAAFIVPSFFEVKPHGLTSLTFNMTLGIVFLMLSVLFDRDTKHE